MPSPKFTRRVSTLVVTPTIVTASSRRPSGKCIRLLFVYSTLLFCFCSVLFYFKLQKPLDKFLSQTKFTPHQDTQDPDRKLQIPNPFQIHVGEDDTARNENRKIGTMEEEKVIIEENLKAPVEFSPKEYELIDKSVLKPPTLIPLEGKPVKAKSVLAGHSAHEPIDGSVDENSCYWSEGESNSWWEIELGKGIQVTSVKVVNMLKGSSWGTFISPFTIFLTSANGKVLLAKTWESDQKQFSYDWESIPNIPAEKIRLSSLRYDEFDVGYFVICDFQVHGRQVAPSPPKEEPSFLVVSSEKGKSCNEACDSQKWICSPSHFPLIDAQFEFSRLFPECILAKNVDEGTVQIFTSRESLSYLPAYVSTKDQTICLMNESPFQISTCGSFFPDSIRICPCIQPVLFH
eukprot:Sdes_comp15524_c0_seq1m4478